MKTLFLLVITSILSLASLSQAATTFTATLSGYPFHSGQGTFSLDGNNLSYMLRAEPFDFNRAEIRGPGDPNQTAPVLYNLRPILCVNPIGSEFGYCRFQGTLNITDSEASDLQNGLWYVKSYFDADPDSFIRGQITVVPEPSTWVLAGLGAGWLVLRGRRK